MFKPIIGPPEFGRFGRYPYVSVGILTNSRNKKGGGRLGSRLYVAFKLRPSHRWRRGTVLLPGRSTSDR